MAVVNISDVKKQRLLDSLGTRETLHGTQYCFHVSYVHDGNNWCFELWTSSEEDAKARVESIRATAKQQYMNVFLRGDEDAESGNLQPPKD